MTEVKSYDRLHVPLTISEDTVSRALLRVADSICMYYEMRFHIEQAWARAKETHQLYGTHFRRERLAEYQEAKVRIDSLTSALSTMIGAMMFEDGEYPGGTNSNLLRAAVENTIEAVKVERQRARETEQPQWYRREV